jgi:PAS domain-containing protein
MAEQEEEMRQNMEELKATQEESGRREEDYRGIAEALDQTLFRIEYDLNGIIRAVNEKLCIFLGRSSDEIVGHSHHEIFESTLKPDVHFWDELQKTCNLLYQRCKSWPEIISTEGTFLQRFRNNDGILVKFINFATDDRAGNS